MFYLFVLLNCYLCFLRVFFRYVICKGFLEISPPIIEYLYKVNDSLNSFKAAETKDGNTPLPLPKDGKTPLPLPKDGKTPLPLPKDGNTPLPLPKDGKTPLPLRDIFGLVPAHFLPDSFRTYMKISNEKLCEKQVYSLKKLYNFLQDKDLERLAYI